MNKRIEKIASFVVKGAIVADIGTDHAQLPILLIENGICDKAYACDVRKGPLNSAKENIKERHLEDQIQVILSDGFQNVPEDITCAVIAGMGVLTAIHILEEASQRLPTLDQIIVQVNDDVPLLRQYISDHHYTILDEEIVLDRGKYYTILEFDTNKHESYSEIEIMHGPILMEKNSELYQEYVQKQIHHLKEIIKKASSDIETIQQLEKELALWQKKSR